MRLPNGWVSATLADFGKWSSGGTPSRRRDEYFGGDIPWVLTGDLDDGIIHQVPNSVTSEGIKNSSAKVFPRHTLLIAMYGATIGKLGILGIEAATNQACAALLPSNANAGTLPFIYYFLLAQRKNLREAGKGGAQPNISQTVLKNLSIPVPPLNEQRRIVERIETLFAWIDKGEEALREVQNLLKRYRQSILKAAVTGELTRDWREANQHKLEPASGLLARILETRRENWQGRGKYKEPAAPDATQYYELPECWALSSTEQLAYVETGATPKKSESGFYSSEGTPWITSTAVNEDPIRTPQAHITERAIRETNAKLFPAGTLVVAMYGEGKTRGKVSELGIDSASNQACAALLVQHLPSDVARYLKLFYLYNYEAIRRQSAGGVQPNLNLSLIKATQVPLPPEQEVGEILTRVNVKLSTVQELERTCSTELARSTALRQSILNSAFTGKLVPQDRNDEPASELLARIRRGNDQ